MTRDDIIRMAREAGLSNDFGKLGYPYLPELERFANLVAAEALRARLAQPEPAECDGGQCGIGGYCKECPKTKPEPDYEAEFIKDWNEGKVRRVSDGKRMVPEREWVGLTDDERKEIALEVPMDAVCITEAKLKEKNT